MNQNQEAQEFFDSLNIAPSAPIRKRKALQNQDIKSDEVRAALTTLSNNPKSHAYIFCHRFFFTKISIPWALSSALISN